MGNTPYKFENITIEMDENVSMPISELNNLRRMAIENLTTLRINTYIPKMDVKEILRNSERFLNINKLYNRIKKLSI